MEMNDVMEMTQELYQLQMDMLWWIKACVIALFAYIIVSALVKTFLANDFARIRRCIEDLVDNYLGVDDMEDD